MRRPVTAGILETSLYVADLERSAEFYERVFGFPIITDFRPRGLAMGVGPGQVLLLFLQGGSRDMATPHDGEGDLHVAFRIGSEDLAGWEAWLFELEIAVEENTTWPRGGVSLYFRDPDRHLVEVATPGVWSVY